MLVKRSGVVMVWKCSGAVVWWAVVSHRSSVGLKPLANESSETAGLGTALKLLASRLV